MTSAMKVENLRMEFGGLVAVKNVSFEINEGEYKVMGMAPYGNPIYTDKVKKVISVNNDGSFSVNKNYISYHLFILYNKRLWSSNFL